MVFSSKKQLSVQYGRAGAVLIALPFLVHKYTTTDKKIHGISENVQHMRRW